nr:MAL [Boleophthalmus pectinirostris]
MYGWFQNLFKSKSPLASQFGKEAKVTDVTSSPSQTVSLSGATSCHQHQSLLNSAIRWTRLYDVFVCHSSELTDTEEAECLVSFLEAPPHNLRCFLSHRDSCPGAAIPSELCQAVQNSHIKVLLITKHFLKDEWCTYVMHQALADGPMSNRLIPLVRNLLHSEIPPELKVYSYSDLSRNTDRCYALVNRTVLQCK